MKSKISYRMFCTGLAGVVISGMFLDGKLWGVALVCILIFGIIGTLGYMTMNIPEVLSSLEPKSIKDRKNENREHTYQTWIATKKGIRL